MPDRSSRVSRISRESRLLLLTVALCALVLLVLARWRFPDREEAPVPAAPLERLAARASFEAIAADIQRVQPTIAPSVVVLRIGPQMPAPPRRLDDVLDPTATSSGVRHVAALRIGADTAVAAMDSESRIEGIVAGGADGGQAAILATDPVRRLARLRIPQGPARQLPVLPLASLQTPAYVVAVEGTPAGVMLRPVFLGRADRFDSSRWSRPLMPLGAAGVASGALLFTLTGEFLGIVVMESGAPAIAGARDVFAGVDHLATPARTPPATLGVSVQPLTRALSTALGVQRGVVVADVDPNGAASLQPADVITGVDDWSTDNSEELLLRLAGRAPGDRVTIRLVRDGKPIAVTATLAASASDGSATGAFAFSRERNVGSRVTSAPPGSNLLPGDIVIRAGAVDAPTPAAMQQLLSKPPPTELVVLVVRRDGRQRILALAVSSPTDVAR